MPAHTHTHSSLSHTHTHTYQLPVITKIIISFFARKTYTHTLVNRFGFCAKKKPSTRKYTQRQWPTTIRLHSSFCFCCANCFIFIVFVLRFCCCSHFVISVQNKCSKVLLSISFFVSSSFEIGWVPHRPNRVFATVCLVSKNEKAP